jgi:hypothetical protein
MIELYDGTGEKVAEIRGKRLVSMQGDHLATLEWEPGTTVVGRCHADMASRQALFTDGWLIDLRGLALACAHPEGQEDRPWRDVSLCDWAYGREPEPS